MARRKEDTRLAFFTVINEDCKELWLGDFDCEEQMEVTRFSIFSNMIQLIKFGLDQPLTPAAQSTLLPFPWILNQDHSYALDDCELWKICIFSPIPFLTENETLIISQCTQKPPESLGCILASQQLECIIQLRHRVDVKANYITVEVGIDNVRCAVSPSEKFSEELQPPEKLMCETERYFPSRVMISIVPVLCESDDAGMSSLSVGLSSHNPAVHYSTVLSFKTPKDLGIKAISSIQSHTINYWQFDMAATGLNAGCFEWILYDPLTQLQVTSSKPPPKRSILSPTKWSKWNKNRHKKATSPLNNRGGVVFARDRHGQTLTWRMNKNSRGKILKWKVEGTVWLTYWPNESAIFSHL